MGGIQTIVIGDFYQLRPVPNKWTRDIGEYCFKSELWNVIVPHKLVLSSIHRQKNLTLIKAINEVARGCPSEDIYIISR